MPAKTKKSSPKGLISIVVPLFNEAESLQQFYERLLAQLIALPYDYEIIFVDDGSSDATATLLEKIAAANPRVQAISFSRNFGHQMALTAGLHHTRGDAVIVMDGDLQHPPELIGTLLARWQEGNEVVYTVREDAADTALFKRVTSHFFYMIINKLTKVQIRPNAADFRLMDRKAVDVMNQCPERFRFLRGLTSWIGFQQTSVTFKAEPRFAGTSKYSIRKMAAFGLDAVTSFSITPLRLVFYLGWMTSFVSFLYILYALYIKLFTDRAIAGWTSVIILILFLGGIQLLFMGIIGEYIGRIYEEIKGRPPYIIKKHVNKK